MKTMIRKIYIAAIFFGITGLVSKVSAQQMPQTNLYTDNIFNINPAYAGYNSSCLEAYVGHISQWVGVDGAPSMNYLDIHKGLGKNFGFGGGFMLDKTAMISQFSGNLTGSYRVSLSQNQNIRIGLSLGVYQVSINTADAIVQDQSDELVTNTGSGMSYNDELGIIYNYKKLLVGISVPQILESSVNYNAGTSTGEFTLKRHITAFIKYDWDVSDKFTLEPSTMMKRVSNLNQVDVNLMGTYNDLISLGVGYRSDVGMLARFRLRLKEMIVVGYAYEFAGANISGYSSGSHEIMLGIKFCKEKESKPRFESVAIEEELIPVPTPEPVEEVVEEEPLVVDVSPQVSETPEDVFKYVAFYEKGGTEISEESKVKLDEMVKAMNESPALTLEIVGHSCDIGTAERKGNVSKERAQKIAQYMKDKGIDSSRLKSTGASDSNPIENNETEDGKSRNRRVQFILSK